MRKLFGTDGIRGTANIFPMTVDVCGKLAKALVAKKKGDSTISSGVIIIGKDTRISCDIFEHSLAAQFASLGIDVKLIGVCPTPAISILTKAVQADFGIMISASHNPYLDNGIKTFNSNGLKLTDTEEAEIEELMESDPAAVFSEEIIKDKVGRISCDPSLLNIYIDRIKSAFLFDHEVSAKTKIVLDSSNGSFSHIAPQILRNFGFEVISINDVPNGVNINENCGMTHPEVIATATQEHEADIGIAFDGDGDRVLLCDAGGHFLDGDHILAALVEDVLLTSATPPHEVVSTIMSNFGFEKYLKDLGINLTRTPVGDRYISEYMQKSPQSLFGGEPSGHVIVRKHALSGDGLFTALKVLKYLEKSHKKLGDLCNIFMSYPVISRNIKVKDRHDKIRLINNKSVAELRIKYEQQLLNRGKIIVRPSGTESLIRVSVEGEDETELRKIVADISKAIEAAQI